MPTLRLQFENQVLKEFEIGLTLTIGRLPDNTVVIDNPAVSGHHACVFRDDTHFIVEDLNSTNGTFVNEKRITRHRLQHGDALLVGKHKLIFDQMAGGQGAVPEHTAPALANLHDTVYLDTKKHKELLTRLTPVRWTPAKNAAEGATPTATSTEPPKVGVLRVLAGRAEFSHYYLDARTSVIGKSEGALVRLQGWFKPKVAIVITRSGHDYVATGMHRNARINNQPLSDRQSLKDGDVLYVGGLMLEFGWKTSAEKESGTATLASTVRKIAG